MLFAERTKDVALAQAALSQINLAFETMRDSSGIGGALAFPPRAAANGLLCRSQAVQVSRLDRKSTRLNSSHRP